MTSRGREREKMPGLKEARNEGRWQKQEKKEERKKPPIHTDQPSLHGSYTTPPLFISKVHCSVILRMISHFTLSDWDIDMAYRNLRDKMIERDENQIKREMRNAVGGVGGLKEGVQGCERKRYYRARNRWTNWWFSGLLHWVMPSVRTEVLPHNLHPLISTV